MRNFTVASLTVFASATAIKMRSNQIDTTVVVNDNTDTTQPSYESWIGKYNFNGAVDSLLSQMEGCDANRNGVVTIGEIKPCMAGILPGYVYDIIAQYSDDYDIRDDLYLLTLLGPMAYDHDGDHKLSFDELTSYFGSLNYTTDTAQGLIDRYGTVGMDEMLEFVREQRHGGQTIDGQLEGLSDIISSLMHNPDVNHNLDNVVTLRELVMAVNNGMGLNNDIDDIIQQYGENYAWQTDYYLFARLVSQGHDLSDYRQAYKIFETLQLPWAIDTFFTNSKEETGITIDELASFVDALFHLDYTTAADSWAEKPADWKPLEERHITDDFSDFFKNYWYHVDSNYNGDGHVSLVELLQFVNDAAGYPKINVDEIWSMLGDDYKWYEQPYIFGSILASRFTHDYDPIDVQHLDYKQAYDYCESIGLPWLVDTMFTYKDVALIGLDSHEIAEIAENFMYNSEDSFLTPPDGWLHMEDRVYYTEPYMVDEESIRQYALDSVQQAEDLINELFTKLDNISAATTNVELLTEHDLTILSQFYFTLIQATEYYSPGSLHDGI